MGLGVKEWAIEYDISNFPVGSSPLGRYGIGGLQLLALPCATGPSLDCALSLPN